MSLHLDVVKNTKVNDIKNFRKSELYSIQIFHQENVNQTHRIEVLNEPSQQQKQNIAKNHHFMKKVKNINTIYKARKKNKIKQYENEFDHLLSLQYHHQVK